MDRIVVDLEQLRATWQTVRANTNAGLRNGLYDTDPKVHQGIPFGHGNPSGEVSPAAEALKAALQRHIDNATAHLQFADQIVAFLDQMLARYQDADDFRSADIETITDMLGAARPKPQRPSATGFQP